ncbi:DNA mismatch repair protein Msh2 [Rozella allomycis CSF55]|uniref:DNA mismatch repair protein Msh2 n=1 Tax=Rozella allomycis (strain CSF55) TaxID=988480 RepID=A0A4P9YR94_ROZAC|nr:DNA mismatch repair protein Msh2 [Rozella allomycis CSF55]
MQQYSKKSTQALNSPFDSSFLTVFKTLRQQKEDAILFFDRGDVFTVHDSDAQFVAEYLFNTTSVLKFYNDCVYVSFSRAQADGFIRDCLLTHGKRVRVYNKAGGEYKCIKEASPGNMVAFENDWLNSETEINDGAVVISLLFNEPYWNAAFVDTTTRKLGIVKYLDPNDSFTTTEALLIQLGVKEVVLPLDSSLEYRKMKKMIEERLAILLTERKKKFYDFNEEELTRLIKEEDIPVIKASSEEYSYSLDCLNCLVDYLHLIADQFNHKNFKLEIYPINKFMRLDSAAMHALNLFPTNKDEIKTSSLFGLINSCCTQQGSILLSQWIRQPLIDCIEIEKRQNLTEAFVRNFEIKDALRNKEFKTTPNLQRMVKKLLKGSANIQDLIRLYQVALSLLPIRDRLMTFEGIHKELIFNEFVSPLVTIIENVQKFAELIEQTVDLEKADRHEYVLKSTFDDELNEIQEEINSLELQMEPELENASKDLHLEIYKKIKLEFNPIYGHFFRISRNDWTNLDGKSSYTELATQKNGIYLTTETLKSLSDQIIELKDNFQSKQRKLVKELVKVVSTYHSVFENLNNWFAYIDVILSFATLVTNSSSFYVKPKITGLGFGNIEIYGGRHPCLEVQENVSFIANDVQFIKDESVFHIITGPNMGGKSTFIRQTALIVLMAQIGSFVPCQSATISIRDSILARVGASDHQLKGISTFMSEMLETSIILKTATKNSIVIIDELGRGTSTYDGFGLAWSIASYIATQIGCFCFFATHFHELAVLQKEINTVKNFHVSAFTETSKITLLYKLKPGVCDQSFGIHVAKLAKFPTPVLALAKRKASLVENNEKKIKVSNLIDLIAKIDCCHSYLQKSESTEENTKVIQELCEDNCIKEEIDLFVNQLI